jgi:hypothetical protein
MESLDICRIGKSIHAISNFEEHHLTGDPILRAAVRLRTGASEAVE